MDPGGAAFDVEQRRPEDLAKPSGDVGDPARIGSAGLRRKQREARCRAFGAGSIEVAFNAE
jgi:hypothetical protein